MKLFINGEDKLMEKDKLGKKIRYTNCKSSTSGSIFLNIWNFGRYLFTTYDIWDSKNGDILSIEDGAETKAMYEYRDDRFWFLKDFISEGYIKDSFLNEYPGAEEISLIQNTVTAIIDNFRIKFDFVKKGSSVSFYEVSRKELSYLNNNDKVDDSIEEETVYLGYEYNANTSLEEEDTGEFYCGRKCYFNSNGVCKYFDWELESPSGQTPDCKEPFIYIEQKKVLHE